MKFNYKVDSEEDPTHREAERNYGDGRFEVVMKIESIVSCLGGVNKFGSSRNMVQGESEEILLQIVQKVITGIEITECAGALYRCNGKVVAGPEGELIKSLDSLPFP